MSRGVSIFLKGLLSASLLLSPASAVRAGLPRRPAVIIAEPSFAGSPGREDGPNSSERAVAHLASLGYVPGTDLFEVKISDLSNLSGGAMQIAVGVKAAVTGAISPECDIIAGGVSGLIARYALEEGYLDGVRVANLIMVSSPNRGAFLADVVKSVLEMVRQESMLEKETRSQRFLPSLKDLFGLPDEASRKLLAKQETLAAPEWEDEASWISHRSASLWEPLYAEYVKDRHFAMPYVPAESPKETFAGWVRRSFPDVWRFTIVEAAWPKSSGRDLSLPYYEYLSMEVARNQHVMRTASNGSLVRSLFKDAYLPSGWKDAAVRYGIMILRHYAEKALVTVKAELQETLADRAVKLTGLGSGRDSAFIAELIKEDLLVNLGTSSAKRFERIPANLKLEAFNRLSRFRAAKRATRYVSVCCRSANPWGLVWPQLGPNDCLLEVDSGVPPVGPTDLVAVFGGFIRLLGRDLLDDKRVLNYISSVLDDSAGRGRFRAVGKEPLAALDASSWEPRWCGAEAARVTLSVSFLPEGWQFQVWEDLSEQRPGGGFMWAFDRSGNYEVRLSPGAVRLGMRLVRTGPQNPVIGNAVGSAYAQETLARVFVALGEDEPPVSPGSGDRRGTSGGGGSEKGGGGKPGSGDGNSSEVAVGTEDPVPDGLPTVRVVYRSKHTTLKKPKETVHGYWLLDFGDGFRQRVDGNACLDTERYYTAPGTYSVRAESYCDDGRALYSKTWDVHVALAGETHRFTCQSIAPLDVNVTLDGPAKWVTGKRAVFTVKASAKAPPNAKVVSVKYDPGEVFGVIWERAGDFTVGCAASIIVQYVLEDAVVEVENTYVREVPVTVLTTGVTH